MNQIIAALMLRFMVDAARDMTPTYIGGLIVPKFIADAMGQK